MWSIETHAISFSSVRVTTIDPFKKSFKMKLPLLLVAALGTALAVPNGYYHQEYNYKSSSKAYRNNELQRSTDDQGYYRKDGDLEGREKPIIDANSEHSEYVNPNLRNGQYSGYNANADLSSQGTLHAEGGGYGAGHASGGYASGISSGSKNSYAAEGSYGAANYGSTYGANSYGSSNYHTQSIQTLAQRIQADLQTEVQQQIKQHNAYSQQRLELDELERQVRERIRDRFAHELQNAYGQQSIRNGQSYSIVGGKIQTNANYNEQELANLRRNIEDTLLGELRSGYNQRYYQESHHGSSGYSYGYTSTVRPTTYQPIYPSLPLVAHTTVRPAYVVNTHSRYAPISNPESITTIFTRVQSDLDTILNRQLDEVYRQYFSSQQAYQLTNTDVVLQRLQSELRNNLTYLIQEQIRSNYGTQVERNGYMYSVGPNGQISEESNYSVRDLENLRATVERHLIQKLTETFQTYRTRQEHAQVAYIQSTTPRYEVFTTPRYIYTTPRYSYSTPVYYHTTPAYHYSTPGHIHTKGGSASNHYGYSAGSRYSGYDSSASASAGATSSSIAQLQDQFQSELQRELNSAVSRYFNAYSSNSGSYSPQAYQASLQQLGEELNRNVTRHLQEYSASASWSASGNYNQGQVENMKEQLLANLMRQLEQNLQQHFQSSSSSASYSYSSSSGGHANYRPVRAGYGNYQMGQYRTGGHVGVGEDCDDALPYRAKRSIYRPYRYGSTYSSPRQQTEDLNEGQQTVDLGQEIDDSDLTQQVEDAEYGRLEDHHSQQGQVQVDLNELGQHAVDLDDTQQVEDAEFGNLHVGQKQIEDLDDAQLTQQVEDVEYGKLKPSTAYNVGNGQRQIEDLDDSKLTQQVENEGYGKPKPTSTVPSLVHGGQQLINDLDDSQLTQQIEDVEYGNLKPEVTAAHAQTNVDAISQSTPSYQTSVNKRPEEKVKDEIENDLSRKLESVVKKYKELSYSSRTLAQIYIKEISKELDRNVTQKLRETYEDGASSYTLTSKPNNDAEFLKLKDKIYKDLWENFQHKVQESYQYGSSFSSSSTWHSSNTHQVDYSQQTPEITSYSPSNTYQGNLEIGDNTEQQLNKRQIRFVKYVKDKLSLDLKEALKQYQLITLDNPNYPKIYQQIVDDIEKNLTFTFNGYGEYYMKDYLALNEKQIKNIKNQLSDELKLEAQRKLNGKDIPSISTYPSQLNTQPQNVDQQQFLGQEIEDDDVQRIENEPYVTPQKPTSNNFINKPSGNVNNDQNQEFTGQVVEDENDLKLEKPSNNLNKPHTLTNNDLLTPQGQQIVDQDDTQQVEDEFFPVQHLTLNLNENNSQLQQGQVPDGDDNVQKVENSALTPSQEMQPPNNNFAYDRQNSFGYNSRPQGQLYVPPPPPYVPPPPPPNQALPPNDFGYNQGPKQLPPQPPISQPSLTPHGYIPPRTTVVIPYGSQYYYNPHTNTVTISHANPHQTMFHPQSQHPVQTNYRPQLGHPENEAVVQHTDNKLQTGNTFYPQTGPLQPNSYTGYSQQQLPTQFEPLPAQSLNNQQTQHVEDSFIAQHANQNKPPKLVDTNTFIQTEISQQQPQNNLPTLNHVIEQQRAQETASSNLQTNLDVERVPGSQPTGSWVGVNSQGNFIVQGQSKQDAEKGADELVDALRTHINKNNQQVIETSAAQSNVDYRSSEVDNAEFSAGNAGYGAANTGYGTGNLGYGRYDTGNSGYRGHGAGNSGYGGYPHSYNPYSPKTIEETTNAQVVQETTPAKLNYGEQHSLQNNNEEVRDIEPLQPAQANVVQNVNQPLSKPTYGVKGRRVPSVQAQMTASSQPPVVSNPLAPSPETPGAHEGQPVENIETREELTTPANVEDQNLPWWKRFGHKVKQGAQNLKQKIVGE